MWRILLVIAVIGNNLQQPTIAFPLESYTARVEVAEYIFAEIINVLEDVLQEVVDVMQSVVDDAQAMNYHSKELDSVTEFLEASKNYFDDGELEDFVGHMLVLNPEDLDDDELLTRLFVQHGYLDLEKKVYRRLSISMDRIEKFFGEYIKSLSEWRRTKEHNLLTWFNAFKNEKDIERKVALFFDLVETFSEL